MITEDYVSFEVAKLLKEKRFNEKCSRWYVANEPQEGLVVSGFGENQFYINAPTHQMVMKWLREVHNIHIDICSNWDIIHWIYQVFVITPRTARNSYVDKILYTSYEKAVEAGIKYALENLI